MIKPNKIISDLLFRIFFLSLVSSLFIVVFFFIKIEQAALMDFVSLLTGASIIKNGYGTEIYNLQTQTNFQQLVLGEFNLSVGKDLNLLPYLNFPLLSVFFIPFLYFPYLLAFKIYILILLATLLVISILSTKFFKNLNIHSFWIFLPFLYYPSIGAALIGQTSILITLIIFVIYWKIIDKKFVFSGILSGLLLLKIQYIILVPFLIILVKKKGEYLKGLAVSVFVIVALSITFSGFFWSDYLNLLANAQTPEFGLLDSKMFTLYGSLKQLPWFNEFSFNQLFTINAFFYFASLAIFYKLQRSIDINRGFIIAVILTMVFCIHGVDYDQSFLLIPIYILLNNIKSKMKSPLSDKIALITLILTPIIIILEKGVYSSFVLLGIVIVLSLPINSLKERIPPLA